MAADAQAVEGRRLGRKASVYPLVHERKLGRELAFPSGNPAALILLGRAHA